MHPIGFNRVNQTLDGDPLSIQSACKEIGQGYPERVGQRLGSSHDADFWLGDDWRKTTRIRDARNLYDGTRAQRQDGATWQPNENAARCVGDEESGVSFLIIIVEGNNSAKMYGESPRCLVIREGMGLPRGRQQGPPRRGQARRLAVSRKARQ